MSSGLTARLWRSCGSARKTSRIARSCRLCRRCHISRYRRTVCTAARSGTCDQREGGVRHLTAVRRNPFKADARERGALPRRRRARRGRSTSMAGPAWSPAVRTLVASTSLRLPTTQRRPNWSARSRRTGCTRSSRSIAAAPLGLFPSAGRRAVRDRDRRSKASPSTSRKRPWATRSSCRLGASPAAPRSWRRCRRCADRRRGNASRGGGAAKFFSARPARAVYSFSARMVTKQLCLRTGTRRT
jgi:hypothetical protein